MAYLMALRSVQEDCETKPGESNTHFWTGQNPPAVVLVCNHLDQVYGHHDSQDHTCNRHHDGVGQILNHAENTAIPSLWGLAYLYGYIRIYISTFPDTPLLKTAPKSCSFLSANPPTRHFNSANLSGLQVRNPYGVNLLSAAPAKLRERQGFHTETLRQRKARRAEVQGPCRPRLHQHRP